jgi:Ca2+-binding RTX toxin-like protein
LSQSQSNRVEVLESRTLFSAAGAGDASVEAALRRVDRINNAPAAHLDEWPLQAPGALRAGRTLYIRGTDGNDNIAIGRVGEPPSTDPNKPNPAPAQIRINFNNQLIPLQPSAPFRRVFIDGLGGDDRITIASGLHRSFRPKVMVLRGGIGKDTITGDRFNEYILGEAGDDTLVGGGGRDIIDGGEGNDTITGGDGPDILLGRAGDDVFNNGEGELARGTGPLSPRDVLLGGDGNDTAVNDPADVFKDAIETLTGP